MNVCVCLCVCVTLHIARYHSCTHTHKCPSKQ